MYRALNVFSTAWAARAPGGGASAELTAATDATGRFDAGPCLRLDATDAALDHRAERSFPAEDLSDADELRLWVRSTRPGDGADGRPLVLDLRLGSAAVPFDDAANTWRRHLPIREADRWELVRLSLDDLPDAIRTAVTDVRLRVADESLAFTAHLDALFAARSEMVADAGAALVARLDGAFSVEGEAVSAVTYHPTGTRPPRPPRVATRPAVRVRLETAGPARARSAVGRRDYTGDGFRLGAHTEPYALDYALAPFTASWSADAAVLDGLLAAFAPRGEVVAGGVPLPVEWRGISAEPLAGDRPVARVRVLATRTVRPAVVARPVLTVDLGVEPLPAAPAS